MLRRSKPESTRTKTNRNGKICTPYALTRSSPTHDHISVHTKLIEAGYYAYDFPVWNPEWDSMVTKRAKLTDKCDITRSFIYVRTDISIDWNSNMFPRLKEMIEAEQARKERIRKKARLRERTLEFARIYLSRGVYANEPEEGPFMMPSWGIFEDDPKVKALLTEDDCKIPFTGDRYELIEDLIAEGVIKYNIRARRDLARMHGLFLLHWESEEEADENIIKPFLARATTVFHMDCGAAPKSMSYQTFTEISHLALAYWDPTIGDPPKWSTLLLGVTADVLAGRITRELLGIAGAPENSTWEQMERICGKKLVCTCRRPNFGQPAHITTLVSSFVWLPSSLWVNIL